MTPSSVSYTHLDVYKRQYIGSCVPFVFSLVFVLFYEKIGITMVTAMVIALIINALWWFLVTVPLLRHYRQVHYTNRTETERGVVTESLRRLGQTLLDLKNHKKIFVFMIAYFFYIDGVYTIIEMATAYGSALGPVSYTHLDVYKRQYPLFLAKNSSISLNFS